MYIGYAYKCADGRYSFDVDKELVAALMITIESIARGFLTADGDRESIRKAADCFDVWTKLDDLLSKEDTEKKEEAEE